jgi:Ca2+-binding RTX toxin-like protein
MYGYHGWQSLIPRWCKQPSARRRSRLDVESLEERTVPTTAQLNGTVLQIQGDTADSQVTFRVSSNNNSLADILDGNALIGTFARAAFTSVTAELGDGNDTLTIDFSNGDPTPSGGVAFDGGSGSNPLVVNADGDSATETLALDVVGSDGRVTGFTGPITYTVADTQELDLTTGQQTDSLNVLSTAVATFLLCNSDGNSDEVRVGDAGSVQGITGPLSIYCGGSSDGGCNITIDDSADATARAITLDNSSTKNFEQAVFGLAPAEIDYDSQTTFAIIVNLGSGGSSTTINRTPIFGSFANGFYLNGGSGTDALAGPTGPHNWEIDSSGAGSLDNTGFFYTSINKLIGSSGNDTFNVGEGAWDGSIIGGAGNDTYYLNGTDVSGSIDGVSGADMLFFGYRTPITVNLITGTASHVAGGIQNIPYVIGGAGDDTIIANSANNLLVGGGGHNTYIFDADTPQGSDLIEPDPGDILDFSATTTLGVKLDLTTTAVQTVNSNLKLKLEGDIGTVIGTPLADRIVAAGIDSVLSGGAGNDTYVIDADVSNIRDKIIEAANTGIDTLDFSKTTGVGVSVDLSKATAQTVGNLTLTLSTSTGIENVIGTAQDDRLAGNSRTNVLTGGAGNDIYVFNTNSAQGSDTVVEAASAGTDTLDFAPSTALGVTVDLSRTTTQTVNSNLNLTLSSGSTLENVIGGTQADRLTGNSRNNVLTGGAGNDTYVFDCDSALGSDTVVEAANVGIDTLDFSPTTTKSIAVALSTAAAQTVNSNLTLTLSTGTSLENVIGGALADRLEGNSRDNVLAGGAGNDTYKFDTDHPLGSDTVVEAANVGIDTLDFSGTTTKGVAVDLSKATAQTVNSNLTLTLSTGTSLENIIGGSQGDTLTGNSRANVLNGLGGNDTYRFDCDSALNKDTVVEAANAGIDTLDFSATTTKGIVVDLNRVAAQTVNSNLTLTLSTNTSLENVIGGALADRLAGNSRANVLMGGPGNDTYAFDTDTAQNSDTVNDASGIDTLDFSGTGTKTIAINLGLTTAQTVNSNLTLTLSSGSSIENVIGGTLSDALTGNSLNNVLSGGGGDDILKGGDGQDILLGGAGSDTLNGGNGEDVVLGATYSGQSNVTALIALMAEWGRTDGVAYQDRIDHLMNGGGKNGSFLLTTTGSSPTVTEDGALDNLTGGAGLDWFISHAGTNGDAITDPNNGGNETITPVI